MSTHLEGFIQKKEISLISKASGEISFIQHNVKKKDKKYNKPY